MAVRGGCENTARADRGGDGRRRSPRIGQDGLRTAQAGDRTVATPASWSIQPTRVAAPVANSARYRHRLGLPHRRLPRHPVQRRGVDEHRGGTAVADHSASTSWPPSPVPSIHPDQGLVGLPHLCTSASPPNPVPGDPEGLETTEYDAHPSPGSWRARLAVIHRFAEGIDGAGWADHDGSCVEGKRGG